MGIRGRQLSSLFFCSLVLWAVGNGLIPLLPIYAGRLGADSAVAGVYLAVVYLAITLGVLSAGWISSRFRRHKRPLILAGLVSIPVTWLMGQATSMWELTAITALNWFTGGLGMALIGILTGLSAGEKERGKIFGVLTVTAGLGALVGNLGIGWLVDHWGYTAMFSDLALFLILFPLVALLLKDPAVGQPQASNAPAQKQPGLGKSFYLLFISCVLASMTFFFILLMRSLQMDQLAFGPFEISSTGAIGALIAMPFPVMMGWLSDRTDRRLFLALGYLSALASIVLLAFSNVLWHFWMVLALYGIAAGSNAIGNALVTDLVPRESVGKGLAVFGAATWIGGMIGFPIAGYTLQNVGFTPAVILGACLVIAALGFLYSIRVGTSVIVENMPKD